MRAEINVVKNAVKSMAFNLFDEAHTMSVNYVKDIEKGEYGIPSSVAALTGSVKEMAEKVKEMQGKSGSYQTLIAYLKATGVPFDVSSTYRPGSVTSLGTKSYHGYKRAVDLVGKKPSVDSAELGAIFKAFSPIESLLAELIYAGPQASYNIKNGKRVGKYAVKDHHNHVHAALYRGGIVQGSQDGQIVRIGEMGQSEVVLPMNQPGRIMDITTQAIRDNVLDAQGQQALILALASAAQSPQGSVQNGNNVNIGEVVVKVESNVHDPSLQGDIIARRVTSELKRL